MAEQSYIDILEAAQKKTFDSDDYGQVAFYKNLFSEEIEI